MLADNTRAAELLACRGQVSVTITIKGYPIFSGCGPRKFPTRSHGWWLGTGFCSLEETNPDLLLEPIIIAPDPDRDPMVHRTLQGGSGDDPVPEDVPPQLAKPSLEVRMSGLRSYRQLMSRKNRFALSQSKGRESDASV